MSFSILNSTCLTFIIFGIRGVEANFNICEILFSSGVHKNFKIQYQILNFALTPFKIPHYLNISISWIYFSNVVIFPSSLINEIQQAAKRVNNGFELI